MRVLFVTSTRIGDAILSTGLLNHVISLAPQVRLTVACGPAAAPLFRETPAVERVISMAKQPRSGHWLSLWTKTVGIAWDHVIDLRGSALAWTLFARRRTMLGKGSAKQHRLIQLAKALNLDPPPTPRVWVSAGTRARAASLVPVHRPVLSLGPTANWWGKQWPATRFAELSSLLLRHPTLGNAQVLVLGAANERDMALPLLSQLPADRTIDLIGKVDLLEAYACLERVSLYIGNDSGLMHLAAAAGAPTLGLFGPSPESHYAPWGDLTLAVRGPRSYEQIVKASDFDHRAPRCYMEDLSVERVFEAAQSLLTRVKPARGLAAQ